VKRSNQLSYIPIGQDYVTVRLPISPNRLRVGEADEDTARDAHAEVVQQRGDGTEDGADDDVEHGHHDGEAEHLAETEHVLQGEVRGS
jgi:hypothetical protein